MAGWGLGFKPKSAEYQSGYAIAAYILVCAVINLIATALMKDYTGKDIEGEYE